MDIIAAYREAGTYRGAASTTPGILGYCGFRHLGGSRPAQPPGSVTRSRRWGASVASARNFKVVNSEHRRLLRPW
jgi:hypothetical protein